MNIIYANNAREFPSYYHNLQGYNYYHEKEIHDSELKLVYMMLKADFVKSHGILQHM